MELDCANAPVLLLFGWFYAQVTNMTCKVKVFVDAYIVSTANTPLVGTLMTIGDVTSNIAI